MIVADQMIVADHQSERARVVSNRAVHQNRLVGLDQAAQRRAEKLTRSASDFAPTFGRHASDWSRRHEARFQAELAAIVGEQRADRASLEKKIARRTEALRTLILIDAREKRVDSSRT